MNYFSSNFKLGILGGGQLGKMLLYNTRKFDIFTSVLDANEEAPCKISSNEFHLGDLMGYDAVYNFGKKVDVLTIEIEHVNVEALEKLEAEGIEVHPAPALLKIIQNKAKQKERKTRWENLLRSELEVQFDLQLLLSLKSPMPLALALL